VTRGRPGGWVLLAVGVVAAGTWAPAVAQEARELAAPGISAPLAQHRARTLSDIRYDLAFRVPARRVAPVEGTLELRFRMSQPGPLVLDFADPSRVRSLQVNGIDAPHTARNNHLVVPASALEPGENRVWLEFTAGDAPLNRHDDFLYTLFVPARAHEAFPAFDQPDLKARFRLTLHVPLDWVAVANGATLETREAGEEIVYRFAETQPLPTYLFSFAAGHFQVEETERDGRPMRMFHRETDADAVARNRDAIFDLHAASLAWLEAYTGIPYPFGKFDFVAVPSFQYNGMEHPGAILYRASSLVLDETATRNQQLGRASLIAHETAHMWFGDLVTMTWFDDVWMKEVFANFMAAKIVHPSFPDLDHDLRFLVAHHPAAYAVDRTPGANPIRQDLANLDDAASLYGAIIYQKAPIVMRQLEALAGEDAFQDALRRYLSRHAFGNAAWPDLVGLLDEVAPLDVHAWSRVWVDAPGRPTVRVHRTPDGVVLHQDDPRERGLRWPQALTVRTRHQDGWLGRPVLLEDDSAVVTLPESAHALPILPNGDGLGYGLFLLDDATRDALIQDLPGLPDALARAVAWIDLHEMMLEGAVAPRDMLDLALRAIRVETDELVEQEILGTLPVLFWRWVGHPHGDANASAIEDLLWTRMEEVDDISRKAAYFHALRALATSPQALRRLEALWRGDHAVPGLQLSEQDLTALALDLAVRDVPDAHAILDEQERRIDNPDRRERFQFVRRAADPDPAVRDAFFADLANVEHRRREEWVVTALRILHHPLRAQYAVRYLRPALDLLREVRDTGDIFFPIRWLDATFHGHATATAAGIVAGFIAEQEDYPPRLMEKLLQAADPLLRAAELRP
jgi:aminopeptidase N